MPPTTIVMRVEPCMNRSSCSPRLYLQLGWSHCSSAREHNLAMVSPRQSSTPLSLEKNRNVTHRRRLPQSTRWTDGGGVWEGVTVNADEDVLDGPGVVGRDVEVSGWWTYSEYKTENDCCRTNPSISAMPAPHALLLSHPNRLVSAVFSSPHSRRSGSLFSSSASESSRVGEGYTTLGLVLRSARYRSMRASAAAKGRSSTGGTDGEARKLGR